MDRPLAFVYNWVPDYRAGLLELLAEREGARLLLFGGRSLHPQSLAEQLAGLRAPAEVVSQRQVYGAVRRGRYRAVVASTNGRLALPAAYAAARRERLPFVLWATLWRHPRTAAHALSWPPMRRIYRRADAVVTYGPHVSRYLASLGRRERVFEAPQATDNQRFGRAVSEQEVAAVRARTAGRPFLLFAGRLVEAKGVRVLAAAWREIPRAGAPARGGQEGVSAEAPGPVLAVIGDGPLAGELEGLPDVVMLGRLPAGELAPWYAEARALVLPSIPTRPFLEPWGYVVNEALLQETPAIASDAAGAAAGGLVEDGLTGLVVPAGDAAALAAAAGRLLADPGLAARLGAEGRARVLAGYTHVAQARGFEQALAACGVSRCRS